MTHKEEKREHQEKEREQRIKRENERERAEEKQLRKIHPGWFVALGVVLTGMVIVTWTLLF